MYEHAYLARKTARNLPVHNKIRKMWRDGRIVEYEVVYQTDISDDAFDKEKSLIASIGRRDRKNGPLMNLTDGGEGVRGYSYTDEHRKNLSSSIKRAISEGRWVAHACFPRNESYRRKISDYHKANPWTDEQKKALSKKMKLLLVKGKRVLSDDARRRMSEAARRGNMQRANKRNTS